MPAPLPADLPPARPIRFVHQGQIREVSGLPPTTTVLQWLREHAHCTGTKEGCAEGDCGACTVVVGESGPDGQWQQQTVNACIQFLPALDGRVLLTVEDVSQDTATAGELHPCQQAMVACHGSQCGFCTPGFIMSLWDVYQGGPQAPDRATLADALSGNLCRCTGYRPILDAGEAMFKPPHRAWSPAATQALLAQIDAADGLVYAATPLGGAPGSTQRFWAPRDVATFSALRAAHPQARLLAGGTDIGLWVNKQFRELGDILYVGRVAELQQITEFTGTDRLGQPAQVLRVGAGVSLEAAWARLAERVPALRELWLRFASPPVRHAGTMVGNLANGSPIGDGGPVLLALGAQLVLRLGDVQRTLPLDAFYLDYMKNALQPGEWIEAVEIPLPAAGDVFRAYKVSKRRDSDISAVCAGLWLRFDGERIAHARLGWGGMAATARLASRTQAALVGQPWTEATVQQAQAALAQDFTPMSDQRASAGYRQRVAANLLTRFWLETRAAAPLPADQAQVWPALP
jgi:xanthine dehydrogenase small subunit